MLTDKIQAAKNASAMLDAGMENMKKMSQLAGEEAISLGIKHHLFALRYLKEQRSDSAEEMASAELKEFKSKETTLVDEINRLAGSMPSTEMTARLMKWAYEKYAIYDLDVIPLSEEEYADAMKQINNDDQINQANIILANLLQVVTAGFDSEISDQSDPKQMQLMIDLGEALRVHIETFRETHDLNAFKANIENTFRDTRYGHSDPASFFVRAHDAVIYLFRAFFRLFDHLVTAVTGASKLMRDTETPFAQKLVGRPHFFSYYPTPVKPEATKLEQLKMDFAEGIKELDAQFKGLDEEEIEDNKSSHSMGC